jgi:hypothetical protein
MKTLKTKSNFHNKICKTAYLYCQKYKENITFSFLSLFIFLYIFFPENVLAVKLEEQLDSINKLTTGKFKTYGISGATIAGGIWSLFKGNIKMTGVIVAIGVILGYYLSWVDGGMVIA